MGLVGTWVCGFDVVNESLASEERREAVVFDDQGVSSTGSDIVAELV